MRNANASKCFQKVILCVSCIVSFGLQAEEDKELPVKAAFLLNLLSHVAWPKEAFIKSDNRLAICVICQSELELSDKYRKILDDQYILGRNVVVKGIVWGEAEIPHCHILFVPTECKNAFSSIIEAAKGRHVLIVGDFPDATKLGAMVGLVRQNNKIKLDFNYDAIQAEKIKISKPTKEE